MENIELLLLLKHDPAELCQRTFEFMKATFDMNCIAQRAAYKQATSDYDPEAIMAEEKERAAAAAEKAAAEKAAAAAAESTDQDDGDGLEADNNAPTREDVDRRALFDEDDGVTSPLSAVSEAPPPQTAADSDKEQYPAVVAKHPLVVFAQHGTSTCLPRLQDWIYCYLEVFVAPADEFVRSSQATDTPATPRVTRNKEVATIGIDALHKFVDEAIGDGFIEDCTKIFFDEMTGGVETEVVIAAISTLSEGILTLHDVVPGASLLHKDEEMAVMTVRKLCRIRGDTLQSDFMRRVAECVGTLKEAKPAQFPTTLGSLCRWIYSQCCDALRTLEPLVAEEFACRSRFFERELQERSIRRGVVQGLVSPHCHLCFRGRVGWCER